MKTQKNTEIQNFDPKKVSLAYVYRKFQSTPPPPGGLREYTFHGHVLGPVRFQHYRGPPRGFEDSGRRAIYFQGFGEKGNLFSGIWEESGVLGSRELRKNILGSWGERSFFFQGEKTPPPPPPGGLITTIRSNIPRRFCRVYLYLSVCPPARLSVRLSGLSVRPSVCLL